MYYPSSENKGADQLRGYREADLRLCFRLGKNPVFSRCGSYLHVYIFCFSFDIAYKKGQQGKKDQKKKDKESANQSKGDDENDVETIEDDDDDNATQQEGGGTGGPGVGQGGATNGDVDSVVEISDSSDN